MKKYIALILNLVLFSQSSLMAASMTCQNVEGSSMQNCSYVPQEFEEAINGNPSSDGCRENKASANNNESNISDLNDVANFVQNEENSEPVHLCRDNEVIHGKKMSKRKMRRLRRKLHRQCKKKAKAYKKEVAKNLLGQGKVWQALQARLKSKRKIIGGGRKKNSDYDKTNLELDVSPEELENMNKGEFNSYLMSKIKEQVPNIEELIKQSESDPNDAFKGSLDQPENFPMNVVIQTGGGKKCILDAPNFPKDEFEAEPCDYCEIKEMQDNFTNDCSYMVDRGSRDDKKLYDGYDGIMKYSKYSEDETRSLMGIDTDRVDRNENPSEIDPLCNSKDKRINNDMSELHKTAIRLCEMANDGITPQISIQTSRNLFNDSTVELADKRGQFTQKYLYKRLTEDCNLDMVPYWLSDEDSFKSAVRIEHPNYERPGNVEGDYGPSPYAQGADRDKEIEYLIATLDKEKQALEDEKAELVADREKEEAKLSEYESILGGNVRGYVKEDNVHEAGLQKQYNYYKKQATSTNRNAENAASMVLMNQILKKANGTISEKHLAQQKIYNLNEKINSIDKILQEKYRQNTNGEYLQSVQLNSYYKLKDKIDSGELSGNELTSTQGNFERLKGDLFNQFKMSRIKWEAEIDNPFGVPDEMLSDEVKLALKSMIKIDSYQCELNEIETKKLTAGGILKAPLKIIMGAVTTVVGAAVGAVATGAAIALSPITTALSYAWWCAGCGDPGDKMPDFFRFGNWRLFGPMVKNVGKTLKSPSKRKRVARDLNNFISLGGRLNVYADKHITVHDLKASADRLMGKPYGSLSEDEKIELTALVVEEAIDQRSPASNSDGCFEDENNITPPSNEGEQNSPDTSGEDNEAVRND